MALAIDRALFNRLWCVNYCDTSTSVDKEAFGDNITETAFGSPVVPLNKNASGTEHDGTSNTRYLPRKLQVYDIVVMQTTLQLFDSVLLARVLPPNQYFAKVDRRAYTLHLRLEFFEARRVVHYDEITQCRERRLLDSTRRRIPQGGEGVAQNLQVARRADARNHEQMADFYQR